MWERVKMLCNKDVIIEIWMQKVCLVQQATDFLSKKFPGHAENLLIANVLITGQPRQTWVDTV